jgi:hypothetical protein
MDSIQVPRMPGTQADELDHTGEWRMVRHRQPLVAARDGLAAHHLLADAHDGPRRLADVLRQRHRDPRRKRQAPDRAAAVSLQLGGCTPRWKASPRK